MAIPGLSHNAKQVLADEGAPSVENELQDSGMQSCKRKPSEIL
eukprot:SAG11_NODE_36511_length_261_cov_0.635802_1_plen_42_part_01